MYDRLYFVNNDQVTSATNQDTLPAIVLTNQQESAIDVVERAIWPRTALTVCTCKLSTYPKTLPLALVATPAVPVVKQVCTLSFKVKLTLSGHYARDCPSQQ